jgi:hypothetical protein
MERRRLLPAMIAGWVGLLLVAVVVADRPGHWHAALFLWGVAIGVALALNQVITFRVALRLSRLSEHDTAMRRTRPGIQRKLNTVTYLMTGLMVGVISAKSGFAWVDVALTVLAVASVIVAYVTALVIGGRTRRSREVGPLD